jgi:hypothetical protein
MSTAPFVVDLDVEEAQEYIDHSQDAVIATLLERIDAVNHDTFLGVRANLIGRMLMERSGALLGTLVETPATISGDIINARIDAGGDAAPYGVYNDKGGLGFYTIAPVNAKALMFGMDGKFIFAKMVNHPPLPQRPWFSEPTDEAVPKMKEAVESGFDEVL